MRTRQMREDRFGTMQHEIAIAEEKQSAQRTSPYLLIVFHDGRQVAGAGVWGVKPERGPTSIRR